jgi:hypothetical protein
MHQCGHERTGGDNHRRAGQRPPIRQPHRAHPPPSVALHHLDLVHQPLDDLESARLRQHALHRLGVKSAVGLGPRRPDGWPLAAIEHAELNACPVDAAAHDPAKRIDLAHHLALADPADGRVARHPPDRGMLHGDQRGVRTETRRRPGCFRPGMPAPNHHHVIPSRHQRPSPPRNLNPGMFRGSSPRATATTGTIPAGAFLAGGAAR